MKKAPCSLFEWNGLASPGQSIPLALQHLVAMIVGCISPSIIVAAFAGLSPEDTILLIQSGLLISGVATLIQVFPIFGRIGSRLPMIFGVSFAYVPVLCVIATQHGIGAVVGAQLVGSIVVIVFGLFIEKLNRFFPAVVTGTVVITIGLSLYPTAVEYMAGGAASAGFGSWQNWLVAFITLAIVIFLSFFTTGFFKLSSILFGIIIGYVIAVFMGMVDFSSLDGVKVFETPSFLPFGIRFESSAILTMSIMYIINAVQVIGEISATTSGAMDRMPTGRELSGGIIGNGVSSFLGSLLGGLPTSTFGQNVGIVTTTRIINRTVFAITAVFMLLCGFMPVIGGALTTIPYCVLGGATLSVFASITMTGVRLVVGKKLTARNMSIVGISIALGVGISSAPGCLECFPEWVNTLFGSSAVVASTICAVILNLVLPKENISPKGGGLEMKEEV